MQPHFTTCRAFACWLVIVAISAEFATRAASSKDYSILSESLDGGGLRSSAGEWVIDGSLSNFGGMVSSSAFAIRQGYPGTLNESPVAFPDMVQCQPGDILKIPVAKLLSNDSDLDLDPLRVTEAESSQNTVGTVEQFGNWIIYRAPANFTGEDSFSYSISDGLNGNVAGTVRVLVAPGVENGVAARLIVEPLSGLGFRVSFAALAGKAYRLEYRDTFSPADRWEPIAEFLPGNAQFHFHEDAAGPSARFYRVIQIESP